MIRPGPVASAAGPVLSQQFSAGHTGVSVHLVDRVTDPVPPWSCGSSIFSGMADLLLAWLVGVYARVSRDTRKHTKRERASVNQQVSDALADIADLGQHEGRPVVVNEIYQRDNDVSASRHSTKERQDWPLFVKAIQEGRINFVVLWECSRGSRESVEWLTFLALCRDLAVPIRVVTHERTYDVRNPRDWKTLADEGIDSEVESAKTSRRVKRDKEAVRTSGRPDGPLCYGHKREYDPDTGELLRQVPEPVESRVVLEIFERYVGGEALTSIMRDLNQRIDLPEDDPKRVPRQRRGAKWSTTALRRTLTNPAHIGKRRHPDTGEMLDTQWPPLSETLPATFWAAQRLIKERSNSQSRQNPGKAKYLLTRIMVCGVCNATIARYVLRGIPRYHCSGLDAGGALTGKKGCTAVNQGYVDEYITDMVIARLSQPDLLSKAAVQDDAVVILAQAEADALQEKLDEAYEGYKQGIFTMDQYAERKVELTAKIAAAEAAARDLGLPPVLRTFTQLLGQQDSLAARALVTEMWKGFPLPGKRDVIRSLFSTIRLNKGTVGRFDPDRIAVEWRRWSPPDS